MKIVQVSLGERSYRIQVGRGLLAKAGKVCRKHFSGNRCAVITDARVGPLYSKALEKSLHAAGIQSITVTVPSGETAKSLRVVEQCYNELATHRLERKSFLVALGGGVVGDLAGFVAATYLRGIPFLQIPTTLLSQVDSSVGGKVGVNLKAGKNLVGAFHQPRHVLCDLDTLSTLPDREFRSGLAEVIKYGIISDAALFRRLERDMPRLLTRDSASLTAIIARCCAIKAHVVSQDETESGLRAILNFGHTIGHGLEAISAYGKYLHGEAISIGQVAAAHLSHGCLSLPQREVERIRALFLAAGLPVRVRLTPRERVRLFDAMRLDKKVTGGSIRFVLAGRLGRADWGHAVTDPSVHAALDAVA